MSVEDKPTRQQRIDKIVKDILTTGDSPDLLPLAEEVSEEALNAVKEKLDIPTTPKT